MKLKQYPKYKDSKIQWIGEIPESWTVHKIKYLLKTSVTDGPHETPDFLDEGIPFLSVDSIQDGEIVFEGCRYISEEDYHKYKVKCNPRKNDVFMGKAASIGKIARVKVDFPFSIWSPLALLRTNKKIKSTFFEYVLKSDYSQDQIDNFSTSNTQKNISMDDIPKIQLILPNAINEQDKLINFLGTKTQNIDQTIEKDKKLIELLKEKRIALINHVVTKGLDKNAKMKDSGIDWIGEIPRDWEVKKLKFIADVKVSNVDKKSVIGEPEIKLCNYTDVYYNEHITSKIDFMKRTCSFEQRNKFMLEKGDVMITKDSETADDIAVSAVSKEKFSDVVCGYHLSFIRPKQEIIGDFLFRLFQSKLINSHFEIWALGVTRFGVSTYPIKNSLMILPPKQEQLQIVQYLDKQTTKIDQTINKIQNKITLMQEYKKSLIHHVVTGKVDVRGVEI
jgi:type I restriction enzyme, S subunit